MPVCSRRGRSCPPPPSPPPGAPGAARATSAHRARSGRAQRAGPWRESARADHGTAHRIRRRAPACPGSRDSFRRPRRAPATRRSGPSGCGDRVDEDRDDRLGGRIAEQRLQRLDGAVVDIHAGRDRDVDVGCEHRFRQIGGDVARDVEWTCLRSVVTDTGRRSADAERRHHPVEERRCSGRERR